MSSKADISKDRARRYQYEDESEVVIHKAGESASRGANVPEADEVESEFDGNQTAAAKQQPRMVRWRGMLAPLDTRADYRVIGAPEDGQVRVNQQAWLSHQEESRQGHDGKRSVGRIDKVWIEDGKVWAEGVFNPRKGLAGDVAEDIRNGFAGTVSVDLADGVGEEKFFDADGVEIDAAGHDEESFATAHPDARKLMYYRDWRLSGATLVQDPAFHTGWIEVIDDDAEGPADTDPADADAESVTAGGNRGMSGEKRRRAEKNGHAMPGGRYPIEDEEDLRRAIAAIDRTGAAGTGTERAERNVRQHIQRRARDMGLTSLIPDSWSGGGQKDTDDDAPASEGTEGQGSESGGGEERPANTTAAAGSGWAERVSATAANNPEPAAAVFTNPKLDRPTKITVTDTGRVYGHIACWDTDHISFPGKGIKPPRSETQYAMFHRHSVRCSDGSRVRAGVLVMGTGHADLSMSTSAASAHYDHTGHVVADVRAGEDEHGIWVAGALHPSVTPLQVTILDRYSLSGDWRGGELVSALVVNTPGFPIPDSLAASGELQVTAPNTQVRTDGYGDQYALVAAGVIAPDNPPTSREVAELAEQLEQVRADLDAITAAHREQQQHTARQRVDTAFGRIHRDRLQRITAFAQSSGDARPKRTDPAEDTQRAATGDTKKPKDKPQESPDPEQVGKEHQEKKDAEQEQQGVLEDPEADTEPDQSLLEDGDTGPLQEDWDVLSTLDALDEDDIALIEEMTGDSLENPATAEGGEEGSDPEGETEGGGGANDLDLPKGPSEGGESEGGGNEEEQEKPEDNRPLAPDADPAATAPKKGKGLDKGNSKGNPGSSSKGDSGKGGGEDEKKPRTKVTVTAATKSSWVDEQGGLPKYIKRIAKHLKKKGMSESHAIATAVNVVKKMCKGSGSGGAGDKLNYPGAQKNVNKGSVAQACAAVAKWEAMKAKANAD